MVVLSLILFTGIFLIKEKCFAYSDNFDSYANGSKINLIAVFATSTNNALVSNAKYASSSPNSIICSQCSLDYYQDNILNFSLNIYLATAGGYTSEEDFIFFSDWLGYNGDHIAFLVRVRPILHKIDFYDGITWTDIGTVSENVWANIEVNIESDKYEVFLNNAKIHTLATTTHKIIATAIYNPYTTTTYYDDLNAETSPPQTVDAIDFINPLNNGFYNLVDGYESPYYFNWHIAFNLSTTTVANYPSDRPLVSISFEKPETYTPTIFEMTDFVLLDNEYYGTATTTLIDEDIANYPVELGEYNVIATLWDVYNRHSDMELIYDHQLAQKEINFTIQSATTTTPTAWCSNLCADIATATDLLGEIGNGVNCALRSSACYLFYPHQYNINQFFTQYENFKQVFPFNIFFEITSTIDNVFASTTMASTTGSFGLPMIRKVGTTSQYYILPLLTSSTTANFLGNSNANLLRFSLSSIIYAFYVVGIFLIIW